MSDPTVPPFTRPAPKPGVFYDGHGQGWQRDAAGQWVPFAAEATLSPQQPLQPQVPVQRPTPPAAYTFPPVPSGPLSLPPAFPIDPRLVPLPQYNDRDLSEPYSIAQASLRPALKYNDRDLSEPYSIAQASLCPALKVGGVCHKDWKGKKCQHTDLSDSSDDSDAPAPPKHGRPQGSSNFSKDDTNKLLDIVEKALPLGAKARKAVATRYNRYATGNQRSEHDPKALESKYKGLLKKKPTGEGRCPPEIKRAHRIESLMNEKADTRELSDSDVDAAGAGDSSDGDVEAGPVRTAVTRRASSPPLRHASSPPARRAHINAPDLVNKLSKAFNPTAAKARDDERAERSFQTTHIFTLSQQLRDAQTATDNLRTQITTMQSHIHEAECACKRAELKLELFQAGAGSFGTGSSGSSRGRGAVYKANSDLVRVGGKVRYPLSDDNADKENKDPSSSSHSRHPSFRDSDPLVDPFFTIEDTFSPDTSGGIEASDGPSASAALTPEI